MDFPMKFMEPLQMQQMLVQKTIKIAKRMITLQMMDMDTCADIQIQKIVQTLMMGLVMVVIMRITESASRSKVNSNFYILCKKILKFYLKVL